MGEMPGPEKRKSGSAHVNSNGGFEKVVVGADGSESSERAARTAVDIAERLGSDLIVLHILPKVSRAFAPVRTSQMLHEYYSEQKKAAEAGIERVVSLAQKHRVEATSVLQAAGRSAAEGIVHYAAKVDAGLIVVGTRGLGGFKKLRVGSVSSGVVAHAHCPVLVIR